MSDVPSLALDRCRVERALSATVEIVEAGPADRHFPDRVHETLGVCLKIGADHDVRADGRELRYPANSVCVRPPGCVWATPSTGQVGFLSLDIEASHLPDGGASGSMRFANPRQLPDLRRVVRLLRGSAAPLEKQSAVAELVGALLEAELLSSADVGRTPSPHAVTRARELLPA
ncbi:MAG TPA: hypothetical protein VK524_14945 [Polyangiaceae bacterium]|nr:hypothetical protein [Polyangiaceae bacterium]